MLDCISRRPARRRLPGRHADGHELLLRPDPGADPRQVPRGARADHEGVGTSPSRSPSTASTTSCATSTAGRSRSSSRIRRSTSRAAGRSRRGTSASTTTTTTPTSPSAATWPARRCSTATGSGVADAATRTTPRTGPAFAQIICVADTDEEAEKLYAEHILYFFNRCLHVYPGFSDPPGYRTVNTIKAGMLDQFRAENAWSCSRS